MREVIYLKWGVLGGRGRQGMQDAEVLSLKENEACEKML